MRSLSSIGLDEHLDVFIVDDGSGMVLNEGEIASAFQAKGTVYFVYLSENQGIQHALNRGLLAIGDEYEYIARLDCDDLCAPNRFVRQMSFLDAHQDIALVGSAVTFMQNDDKALYTLYLPQSASSIKRAMHINCAFIHPSVMWRASIGKKIGYYPIDYPMAEDFAYFWRFVMQFKTANLPDVLVWTKLNPGGLSVSKRRQQLKTRLRLQIQYFEWYEWVSYYGVLKTGMLMLTPYRWVLAYKKIRGKL